MLGLGLITQVANLAGTMIEGKTAVKKAEAETKMKIATGEIDWDIAAMKATENSWKDEWITLLFSIPLILAFQVGISIHWVGSLVPVLVCVV